MSVGFAVRKKKRKFVVHFRLRGFAASAAGHSAAQ